MISVERDRQQFAGVEVKASATVTARDFAGLDTFAELTQKRFTRGVVLYLGSEIVSFGPKKWAVPIAALLDGDGRGGKRGR